VTTTARPRLLLSMAAWTSGASGGDMHLLTSARRWSDGADICVVCPTGATPLVREFLPTARLSTFRTFAPTHAPPLMAAEYLRRLVPAARAARRLGRVDVAIAGSHFVPDAAAVSGARARRRAGFVYHLSSSQGRPPGMRTALALAGESMGVAWLRRTLDLAFVSNDVTITDPSGWQRVARTDVGIALPTTPVPRPAEPRYACAFVARLVPTKGVRDLIRAFHLVASTRPSARMAIVGTGPEADPARALARQLGVADHIDWLGFVTEEEKAEVLAASQVFMFPSYEEGWGIALCEALSVGTPVACYDLPVYRGIFPEGLVTAPRGDWRALAARCAHLIDHPDEATVLGLRGQADVSRYDVDHIARRELDDLLG